MASYPPLPTDEGAVAMRTPTTSRVWRLLAAAMLTLLLATACGGDGDTAAHDSGVAAAGEEAAADVAAASPTAGVGLAQGGGEQAAEAAVDEAGATAAATDPTAQPDAGGTDAPLPAEVTAATGERVVKEGTVTIEIEPGQYDAAFGQLVSRAQALGGHVSGTSSSVTDGPDGQPLVSGQITIRVPVRNFEDLLTSVGEAGDIVDRDVTSQDVTAEYTDLESRRRNLQAQERFYLDLLAQATEVADAIAVQQQLESVTAQIEQITGRLNLLEDRTAFSTLTVRIREHGAEPLAGDPVEPDPSLAPYIDDAVDTFITTVGALIVFSTFVAPFAVLALIGYGIWRVVRRARTRPLPVRPDRGTGVVTDTAPPGAAATTLEGDDTADVG